jgi:hypothetical protein
MARRMKREDPEATPAQIAARLGDDVAEMDVVLALATLRSRNPRPGRVTVNATPEAAAFVAREAASGEPRWATLDRLLAELVQLRAKAHGRGYA